MLINIYKALEALKIKKAIIWEVLENGIMTRKDKNH
jgi:hypothetical protein